MTSDHEPNDELDHELLDALALNEFGPEWATMEMPADDEAYEAFMEMTRHLLPPPPEAADFPTPTPNEAFILQSLAELDDVIRTASHRPWYHKALVKMLPVVVERDGVKMGLDDIMDSAVDVSQQQRALLVDLLYNPPEGMGELGSTS